MRWRTITGLHRIDLLLNEVSPSLLFEEKEPVLKMMLIYDASKTSGEHLCSVEKKRVLSFPSWWCKCYSQKCLSDTGLYSSWFECSRSVLLISFACFVRSQLATDDHSSRRLKGRWISRVFAWSASSRCSWVVLRTQIVVRAGASFCVDCQTSARCTGYPFANRLGLKME